MDMALLRNPFAKHSKSNEINSASPFVKTSSNNTEAVKNVIDCIEGFIVPMIEDINHWTKFDAILYPPNGKRELVFQDLINIINFKKFWRY